MCIGWKSRSQQGSSAKVANQLTQLFMTVCIAVQVNDCIVFAADSATSMLGQDQAGNPVITNVYNYGKKVFCLHKGLPVMAMTCGMGSIGGSSIDVVAKDFRGLLMSSDPDWSLNFSTYTIREVAEKAHRYFFEEHYAKDPHKPTGPHSFELFVGGVPSKSRQGEIWKIAIINGQPSGATQVMPAGDCGILWSGQPEAVNRLILGYSSKLPDVFGAAGIAEPQLSQLMASIRAETLATLYHPAMPVQDAIDLAHFLVTTTINFTKFLPGANTVGGAVDVATVTRHEGFKWIERKLYYSSKLNPLETDHVGDR